MGRIDVATAEVAPQSYGKFERDLSKSDLVQVARN